jgi:aspartate aminotransferase
MVRLASGVPVTMDTTKTGFKVTPEGLEKAITPKTKALILNSPSNPTGAVYTEDELRKIADIIVKHDIVVISDDIYEALVYAGQKYICIAQFGEEIYKRSIIINGVSKSYAMTGWRIGYALGPVDVVKSMSDIQSHATSGPCSISQKASVAAIKGDHTPVRAMVTQFKLRLDYMAEKLAAMPGVECPKPEGAFYCFPKVSSYFGKSVDGFVIKDSFDFSTVMLEKAHIALVAGGAFGSNDYVRLSYATSMEKIKEGLDRMEKLLLKIK